MTRRKLVGQRRRGKGWRVEVRVNGHLYTTTFDLASSVEDRQAWRDDQVKKYGDAGPVAGSFGADIDAYLARVAAMPIIKQRTAHLQLWADELGATRPRRSITAEEIDVVLQDWLETLKPNTVRKRRTALQSFFAKMDGKTSKHPNPVKGSKNPTPPKLEARDMGYPALERAIAAMPDQRDTKKGLPRRVNLSKIRARVIAYAGIPPGMLKTIKPHDLQLQAGMVRIDCRKKGGGVEARTLKLSAEALAAFREFHAANGYGYFATQSLNRSFQRGCKKAGLDPKSVHLYDARHTFLSQVYRVTRDLATVGRLGLHAEGSVVTARYAKGANQDVDAAAVAAFSAALATQRQASLKTASAGQKPSRQSPAKVTRRRKSLKHVRLRAVK